MKGALIDIFAHGGRAGPARPWRPSSPAAGLAEVAARIEKAITTSSVWGAGPEAAPDDVLMRGNILSPCIGNGIP